MPHHHHHCPCPPAHHCHRPCPPQPAPTWNPAFFPSLHPSRQSNSSSGTSCTVRVETPPMCDDAAAPLLEPSAAANTSTANLVLNCVILFVIVAGILWFCFR